MELSIPQGEASHFFLLSPQCISPEKLGGWGEGWEVEDIIATHINAEL